MREGRINDQEDRWSCQKARRFAHFLRTDLYTTPAVQHLDATVSKMPEGDARAVWKEQVTELQRDLQAATEKMLSQDQSASTAQSTGMASAIPAIILTGSQTPAPQSKHLHLILQVGWTCLTASASLQPQLKRQQQV